MVVPPRADIAMDLLLFFLTLLLVAATRALVALCDRVR
jgi:hypothetical protein